MTIKKIYQEGKLYLLRFSWPIKSGTIKLHIIFQSDNEEPHTHPWNFKSLLLIPYKEEIYIQNDKISAFKEIKRYIPFTLVSRDKDDIHRVKLYKILGMTIPAITIGKYGHKVQLCSFCQSLGYCKTERK